MPIRNLFTTAPLILAAALVFTTNVRANDDLLTQLAAAESTANDAAEDIDEKDFGLADVESLINEGEEEVDSAEAVAACYRRFSGSYGYQSYGHRSYGYRSYGYRNYSSYYTPTYHTSYAYHTPSYCYTPVSYSYATPVYSSYWGCW